MQYGRIFLIPLTILALAACASTGEVGQEVQIDQDVEHLYNKAADALDQENYTEAKKYFSNA